MRRWVTTLVGAAIVVAAIGLVLYESRSHRAGGPPSLRPSDGAVDAGEAPAPAADSGARGESRPLAAAPDSDGGAGNTMPDGSPVPPLPRGVPRQIRFGVVLVSYAGAQPSASGDQPSRRSRAEAKEIATRLAATARHDFRAAVAQGDTGSADDVGIVELGVLEPAPEYVLFTLPVDGVGGPVDSPRGFWIVKRIE